MEYFDKFELFPTPVFRYGFNDIEQHYTGIIDHLVKDELYFTERERNGIQTTDGDLFKHKELEPITKLFNECFSDALNKLGYEQGHGITSMWATRHRQGGFHHQHSHKNAFLAAVLYLLDADQVGSGTTFHNMNSNLYQIQPRVSKEKEEYFKASETIPFIQGTVLVFPSFLPHSTLPSPSRYRVIVAANMMPIGRTNADHYDQYYYPDPKVEGYLNLEEHIKAGYGK